LLGIATAAAIRGLGVIIPTAIVWKTVATVIAHGRMRRGYLGIAGQPVTLPDVQRGEGRAEALLIVGVTDGSPAAAAGLLVGDVLVAIDAKPVESPQDLMDRLLETQIGRPASLRVLRGGAVVDIAVTVGERPGGELT
jgi:S1-C subfamily serine protease